MTQSSRLLLTLLGAGALSVVLVGCDPMHRATSPSGGSPAGASTARRYLAASHRVVFLGDSITYSGQYIDYVEAALRRQRHGFHAEFIDLGLPSETVSGLSEPGHAGGAFPRPDLHERLERVLTQAHPDLVVACYGMNDGIYYPFGEERFRAFRDGMERLHARVTASGARIIHVTPPVFDPKPLQGHTLPAGKVEYRQPYEGYNEVLDRYSEWLMSQTAKGWVVVDAHTPMNRYLARRRATEPNFVLAGDGVHAGELGHWLIARALLQVWQDPPPVRGEGYPALDSEAAPSGELIRLIHARNHLLSDAWLTATGHKRPGMGKGLPLPEAEAKAKDLAAQIEAKIREVPTGTAPEPAKH